jgi:fructosamine-3-kinase
MLDPTVLYKRIIFQAFGKQLPLKRVQLIAAGNLNQGVSLETEAGKYFLKTNHLEASDIFLKEIQGLELLRKNTSLNIPEIIQWGRMEDTNYLLLEWVPSANPSKKYWQNLAEGLAELHMATWEKFGLQSSNFISILPQNNSPTSLWASFYIENRLEPMMQRAYYHQLVDEVFMNKFRELYPRIEGLFPKEKPALLHGDLWSGNVLVNGSGEATLIDPAVYFGHREMDIAFSKLFGGFEPSFYESYQEVFPLEPGFEERKDLYNLYPLLVHLNLFGTGYLAGIKRTINRYV